MKKQAIQFEEGDVLLEWTAGSQIVVRDGAWGLINRDGEPCSLGALEQAILDKLTEIVKPLRTHKIGPVEYREDGRSLTYAGGMEWHKLGNEAINRDLFRSWGWPIPAHMEEK